MRGAGWHGRFHGCGRRMTGPRQSILQVLRQSKDHLSAEEIYMKAHKICPSCGLTTIYRTLDLLVQMGMVTKFDFGDKRSRYELQGEHSNKTHHHHLVCRLCNRIIDYSDFIQEEVEFLKKVEEGLARKYRFKVEDHEIGFRGLCEKCA